MLFSAVSVLSLSVPGRPLARILIAATIETALEAVQTEKRLRTGVVTTAVLRNSNLKLNL